MEFSFKEILLERLKETITLARLGGSECWGSPVSCRLDCPLNTSGGEVAVPERQTLPKMRSYVCFGLLTTAY
jgi:hypothetical protein